MKIAKLLMALVCVVALVACSAQRAEKEVDAAAQDVVKARAEAAVQPNDPAKQVALQIALENYPLAVAKYERAKAEDNVRWEAALGLGTLAGTLLGFPLGGLLDPFRRLITGQKQGAQMATTALTNADIGNALQSPTARTAIDAGLAHAPVHVTEAVNANV